MGRESGGGSCGTHTQGGYDHLWIGDDVALLELGQRVPNLPPIDVGSVEEVNEVVVEL